MESIIQRLSDENINDLVKAACFVTVILTSAIATKLISAKKISCKYLTVVS